MKKNTKYNRQNKWYFFFKTDCTFLREAEPQNKTILLLLTHANKKALKRCLNSI